MIMIDPKLVFAIVIRQIFLLQRSIIRLFGLFYWPALDLILWGVFTIYLNQIDQLQFNFTAIIVGAVIFHSFFIRIVHGITVSFMEDLWTRNLVNLFASPLSVSEYVLGLVIMSIGETIVSTVFLGICAWVLFAFNIFSLGIFLIPFAAILFLFGIALGIFATAVVLRYGPQAEMFTWSIPALMTPLSAMFYPVSALPPFLQWIAHLIPASYAFEGMRAAVLEGSFDANAVLIGLLLSFLYLILASLYIWICYRTVLRRGLFARFLTD